MVVAADRTWRLETSGRSVPRPALVDGSPARSDALVGTFFELETAEPAPRRYAAADEAVSLRDDP
jgi:hypothetical protein